MKGTRGCRNVESACRAVGFAKAEGALHSGLQLQRVTTPAIVFSYGVRIDATPEAHRMFNALEVEYCYLVPSVPREMIYWPLLPQPVADALGSRASRLFKRSSRKDLQAPIPAGAVNTECNAPPRRRGDALLYITSLVSLSPGGPSFNPTEVLGRTYFLRSLRLFLLLSYLASLADVACGIKGRSLLCGLA